MLPPPERIEFALADSEDKSLNHPANLASIYRFVVELRGEPLDKLAEQTEDNFNRLFGGLPPSVARGT
jgi:Tat protein secretion system quality control protein TatD with DNase activity